MKKRIFTWILILGLLVTEVPYAKAISLIIDNIPAAINISVYNNTSYVPLRAVTNILCPDAKISWENSEAIVTTSTLRLTACPGDCYLNANGRMLYINDGIKIISGSTYVPIRVLTKALGASVTWEGITNKISVFRGNGTILSGDNYYNEDSLYWLSHIIYAENGIEPLRGKIAVGDVVLNRVTSTDFPNNIHDVIFDNNWGIQFEPVGNGTVYNTPNEESILAAKLCLDGASIIGNGLYFLDPAKSINLWTVKNCTYITTIGNHQFYA